MSYRLRHSHLLCKACITARITDTRYHYRPPISRCLQDNNLFLGNKVFANLGSLSMVGRPCSTPWTRLAAPASPGDSTLTLSTSVAGQWFAGDHLAISPTEYNISGLEEVVIASVAGAVVTLTAPLSSWHYAGPGGTPGSVAAGTTLSAVVARLTRNVVISANLTTPDDAWGVTLYSYVVQRPDPTRVGATISRWGSMDLRYVQMKHGGKQSDPAFPGLSGSVAPALGVQYGDFLYNTAIPDSNPPTYLEGCAITNGFNYGFTAVAAKHVTINASVFHSTFRDGLSFDADSTGVTLVGTAMLGNYRSPDVNAAGQTPWVRPQSAVFINSAPALMSGNVVAGTVDAGYTIRAPPCATGPSALLRVSNNEAHAVRIGVYILPSRGGAGPTGCVAVDGFKVWKAAHVGILTVDQLSSLRVSHAWVSDSHIGVSLNFIRFDREETQINISDSTIVGSSPATRGCGEATTCMAVTAADTRGDTCGSVLGGGYRRAGLLMPQFTGRAKTCEIDPDGMAVCDPPNIVTRMCSLPWEQRYGTGLGGAHAMFLSGVTFSGFNVSECGGLASHAVVQNPTQTDDSVPAYASRIMWDAMLPDGRFDFRMNGNTPADCADGVGCDATSFVNWEDVDGTLTGSGIPRSTVLGANPALAFASPRCEGQAGWGGIQCGGTGLLGAPTGPTVFRAGVISQVDTDAGHLNLGGLQVTRVEPGIVDLNDNTTWPAHPHLIVPNMTTQLYWPATEPNAIQYQWLSHEANEAVIISLFIQRPYSWQMFVSDCASCATVEVTMMQVANKSDTSLPTLTDPPGTFLFNPQARRLWFTVRGGVPGRTYTLVRTPAVQVTLLLAMSAEQFYGPDVVTNIALLLSINSWQIKVVDVQPGSVSVTTEIRDAQPTVVLNSTSLNSTADAAAYLAQQARMLALGAAITTMANTGQLSMLGSVPVLSVTVLTLPAPIALGGSSAGSSGSVQPVTVVPNNGSASSGLSSGSIAAIVIGSVLGFTILLGLIAMHRARVLGRAAHSGKVLDMLPIGLAGDAFANNAQWRNVNPMVVSQQRLQALQTAAAAPHASSPVPVAGPPRGSVRVGYSPSVAGSSKHGAPYTRSTAVIVPVARGPAVGSGSGGGGGSPAAPPAPTRSSARVLSRGNSNVKIEVGSGSGSSRNVLQK